MEPLAAVIGSFTFEGFEEQTGFSLTASVTQRKAENIYFIKYY